LKKNKIMYETFEQIHTFISQPWPWWMGGVTIGTTLFLLLYFGKDFGLSANLRTMCAADGAGDYADFFSFDWGKQGWNLMVALGAMFGGYIAANYFGGDGLAHVSQATINTLNQISGEELLNSNNVHIIPGKDNMHGVILPEFWNLYSWGSLFTVRGLIIIVGGGFLIGFGARYAGGCTSGHAISGLADLQLPSLIAVIGFFTGGLIMTWFILPYILQIAI
jgi:uncharacterized protein